MTGFEKKISRFSSFTPNSSLFLSEPFAKMLKTPGSFPGSFPKMERKNDKCKLYTFC